MAHMSESSKGDDMLERSLGKQAGSRSISVQIANLADMIPLSQQMNIPNRILKLGILYESVSNWLRKEGGLKPPMDQVVLTILFIVACYIPSLVFSLLIAPFFKKEEKPAVDPSQYRFNQQDQKSI